MTNEEEKNKGGRPFKFTSDQFDLAWQQYFQWVDDNPWIKKEAIKSGDMAGTVMDVPHTRPYTEIGFCVFHNLGEKYIRELADTLKGKEDEESLKLSAVLTQARARCYAQKFEGATVGAFNANIIARDLGMVDRKDITTNEESINKRLTMDEAKARIEELMSGKS